MVRFAIFDKKSKDFVSIKTVFVPLFGKELPVYFGTIKEVRERFSTFCETKKKRCEIVPIKETK